MLTRVVTDSVEAQPVPWLKTRVAAPPPSKPGSANDATLPGARTAEFEAAAEAKVRQSYEAGVRAGREAVQAQLQTEVSEVVQRLATALSEVAEAREQTIRRAEADTVQLAVEIARRVLHRELTLDRSALGALIKAALEKLQSQEVYRVRVHPAQEQIMTACLDQAGRGQSITVVPDPMQPEGGVIFELNRGAMDASVGTQLAEIERGLIDQLETRA